MKRRTKFAARALVISLVLSCCIVPAMAQEGSTTTEYTVTEDISLADSEDNENSWRYSNGELDQQPAVSTLSAVAMLSTTSSSYTTWPTVTGAVAYGIDVSKWQGNIDWAKVKAAGVDYAIIRCAAGSSYVDPYWVTNASKCEELGIPYGTYVYSYATTVAEAVSEAKQVLSLVQGRTLSYPIYYDLEDDTQASLSTSQLAAIAEAFCSTIEAAGYTAGVYANLYWWTTKLTDPVFDNWQKWVAQWSTSCTYNGTYTMWQCSASGIIDGITANTVDLNIDFGTTLNSSASTCTHNYVAGTQTDPTCTAEGSIPYTCSSCGDSYTETLAATGQHVEGEAVTESGGSDIVVYCTVCGVELSRVTTEVSASVSASTSSVVESVEVVGESSAINAEIVEESTAAVEEASASTSSVSESVEVVGESSAINAEVVEESTAAVEGASALAGSEGESVEEASESSATNAEIAEESTAAVEEASALANSEGEANTVDSAGNDESVSAVAEEEEDTESEDADDDTSEAAAETATSSVDTPATGDAANAMVWTISLLMSVAVSLVVMMSYRRCTLRDKRIAAILEIINYGG